MTFSDRNNDYLQQDAVGDPTQKLEWVTPKISLMGAEESEGSTKPFFGTETFPGPALAISGPSFGPS